jgi:hypothetical protein
MSYENDFWDAVLNSSWTYYVINSGNIMPTKPYVYVSDWN